MSTNFVRGYKQNLNLQLQVFSSKEQDYLSIFSICRKFTGFAGEKFSSKTGIIALYYTGNFNYWPKHLSKESFFRAEDFIL